MSGPVRTKWDPSQPLDLSDDEDEDPLAMFNLQSQFTKPIASIRPEDQAIDEAAEYSETESAGGTITRKKKPKTHLPAKTRSFRDWTKEKRSSTEERKSRERSEVVVISSDEASSPSGKGKGKKRERARVELTPPPEFNNEAITTAIDAALQKHFDEQDAAAAAAAAAAASHARSSSPVAAPPESSGTVQLTIEMVVPEGTATSDPIWQWAAGRGKRITTYQEGPLEPMYLTIADRLGRDIREIVLTHGGRKILSKYAKPSQLGIYDGHTLVGYLAGEWEKKEKAEHARRFRLLNLGASPPPDEERSAEPPVQTESAEPAADVQKTRIQLRGAWGSSKMYVQPHVKVDLLCHVYSTKFKKDADAAAKLKLSFDGDVLDRNTTMADLDLEDGDIIDVEV